MILWDSRYEIGIERIDAQHRIFLNAIGEFQEARQQGASQHKLNDILNEIALYARYHFCCEENVMREFGFPEIAEHQNMHYQLLDDMNGRMLGVREDVSSAYEAENFLIHWFADHTTREDTKIGRFINGLPQTTVG